MVWLSRSPKICIYRRRCVFARHSYTLQQVFQNNRLDMLYSSRIELAHSQSVLCNLHIVFPYLLDAIKVEKKLVHGN
jgi:hypothetical protein